MAGPICIALAPVPTMPTRFPRSDSGSSSSFGHSAEWKRRPRKVSIPGRCGILGRFEQTDRADQDGSLEGLRRLTWSLDGHTPTLFRLLELGARHLMAEADIAPDVVGLRKVLEISLNLVALAEVGRPVTRERRGIE